MAYVADLKRRAIAEHARDANAQHYEVPAAFYDLALGPHKKYSSGVWPAGAPRGAAGLAASEEAALALVCERARIAGDAPLRVLDMGCGWGSATLYIAARFPRATVVAVSNSRSQKEHIDAAARARGLDNVTVVTADINEFEPAGKFDRVVSIEMMEHAKNYEKLLGRVRGERRRGDERGQARARRAPKTTNMHAPYLPPPPPPFFFQVASWLKPGGLFFVHIFTHAEFAYHFVDGACTC